MGFLLNNCTLKVYNQDIINSCDTFDCDNDDLNDFFKNDAINYNAELLGKSYCFTFRWKSSCDSLCIYNF